MCVGETRCRIVAAVNGDSGRRIHVGTSCMSRQLQQRGIHVGTFVFLSSDGRH